MHRETVELYERQAAAYRARRTATGIERARVIGTMERRGPVLDAGCGPGIYLPALGRGAVGLDAARAMLDLARMATPGARLIQGDLAALPFRDRVFAASWARQSYLHLERADLPSALGDLHRVLDVGASLDLTMLAGPGDGWRPPNDDFPGRFFAGWDAGSLADVMVGSGFEEVGVTEDGHKLIVRARRAHTIADTVGGRMRVLMCGLNPSLHAADAGVGYVGPGNRFWRAAVESHLVGRLRDPRDALARGVGMTDLVKRATARADEIRRHEFRDGAGRVERLVAWLRPGVVCFVGLQGYRIAVDPRATAGWQDRSFGGVATYVMPSTSGLNAGTRYDDVLGHFRAVVEASGSAPA